MIYKKSWKYVLIHAYGPYYRPKALKSFGDIKEGDTSRGWMRGYHNLSQKGNCWIYGNSMIEDNARISENAKVFNAIVKNNSIVSGDTIITGNRNSKI